MVVSNPFLRPYFLGGWALGVPLDSHECVNQRSQKYGDEKRLDTKGGD